MIWNIVLWPPITTARSLVIVIAASEKPVNIVIIGQFLAPADLELIRYNYCYCIMRKQIQLLCAPTFSLV